MSKKQKSLAVLASVFLMLFTIAPVKASTVRVLLSFPSTFLIFIKPITKNGTQITPHKIQYFTGRNPSMMCIALETGAIVKALKIRLQEPQDFSVF